MAHQLCDQGVKIINAQPQDFVVVDGSAYRVQRSPRSPRTPYTSIAANIDEICTLQKALEKAEVMISKQKEIISQQTKKIEDLEYALSMTNHRSSPVELDDIMNLNGPGIRLVRGITDLSAHKSHGDREEFFKISQKIIAPLDFNIQPQGDILQRTRSLQQLRSSQRTETEANENELVAIENMSHTESDYITPTNLDLNKDSRERTFSFSAPAKPFTGGTSGEFNVTSLHLPNEISRNRSMTDGHEPISPFMKAQQFMNTEADMGTGGAKAKSEVLGGHNRVSGPSKLRGLTKALSSPSISSPIASLNTSFACPDDHQRTALESVALFSDPVLINAVQGGRDNSRKNLRTGLSISLDAPLAAAAGSGGVRPNRFHTIDLFQWKPEAMGMGRRSGAASTPGVFLFIAHDNPQLGTTIAARITSGDAKSVHVMVESKDDHGLTRFLIGEIVFSGDIEGVQDARLENPRGSQFLIVTKMRAVCASIESFPKRVRGDISEIDMDGAGEIAKHDVSSCDKIRSFLKSCTARVDVILDPSHTSSWYPYWEGRRKMAPQFRSKGVGYIRLGDDMSRYGSAFLSLDAGATFLDDGATSIVAAELGAGPGVAATWSVSQLRQSLGEASIGSTTSSTAGGVTGTRTGVRRAGGRSKLGATTSGVAVAGEKSEAGRTTPQTTIAQCDPGSSTGLGSDRTLLVGAVGAVGAAAGAQARTNPGKSDTGAPTNPQYVRELLLRLRREDLKWTERGEALGQLFSCSFARTSLAGQPGYQDGTLITEVVTVLQENVTQQKNPNVLRAAVSCMTVIAEAACCTPSCGIAWRGLLLEATHLLRVASRPVSEEVRGVLTALHGMGPAAGLGVAKLVPLMDDILAGPRGKGSSSAANSARVVGWLEELLLVEIESCLPQEAATAVSQAYELIDTATLIQKCRPLLQHREEVTRQAVVDFLGTVLLCDIVQQDQHLDRAHRGILAVAAQTRGSVSPSVYMAVVNREMSAEAVAAAQSIEKSLPRMYEKTMAACLGLAGTLGTKVAKARSVGGSSSSSSVGGGGSPGSVVSAPDALQGAKSSSAQSTALRSETAGRKRAQSKSKASRGAIGGHVSGTSNEGGAMGSAGVESERNEPEGGKENEGPVVVAVKSRPTSSTVFSQQRQQLRAKAKAKAQQQGQGTEEVLADDVEGGSVEAKASSEPSASDKARVADTWFEARLMLRQVPVTDEDWRRLSRGVQAAGAFFKSLDGTATAAAVARGRLLRAVLPFDESTSSSDQSQVASSSSLNEALALVGSAVQVDALQALRTGAVAVRGLIRVKMADEADLQQAIQACAFLDIFCKDVESASARCTMSPISLLQKLSLT